MAISPKTGEEYDPNAWDTMPRVVDGDVPTFNWGSFQPYEPKANDGYMLGGRTSTTTQPTTQPGNAMGLNPEQEALVRQWSSTGGRLPAAPQTGTTGTGGQTPLQFLAEWQQKYAGDASEARYQELAREMKTRFGIDPAPGASGPSRNEFMINGEKVKVRSAEDSGAPQWFAYGADDGWRPGGDSGMGAGYSLEGGPLSSFSAPGLVAPWTREFQRPDPSQIAANDPSYKFIRDEALQGVQRLASSKGTIYTGGTLKDLQDRASSIASTFDDKYYNRAFGEYGMDRDSFWGNQNNAYSKLSGYAGMGQDAATSTGQFGSQYVNNMQTGATNLGNLATGQANANAGAAIQRGNVATGTTAAIGNTAAGIDWSKLFKSGARIPPSMNTNLTNPVGYDEDL